MAADETNILKQIMMAASKCGQRLLRNNRGQFYTLDGVRALIALVFKGDIGGASAACKRLRQIRAGLEADGASDLIGATPVTITPEMVGCTFAIFTAVEVKKPGWTKPTDDREKEQEQFINNVNRMGGIGFFLTEPEILQQKISENLKKIVDRKTAA